MVSRLGSQEVNTFVGDVSLSLTLQMLIEDSRVQQA